MHKVILIICALALSACTTENNYRGVPEPTWKQLSAEQKQLIVDRSFQEEFKNQRI